MKAGGKLLKSLHNPRILSPSKGAFFVCGFVVYIKLKEIDLVNCYNCGKPPMYYLVDTEGQEVPLCLDCYSKHAQILAIQNDQLERNLNYLANKMDRITGIPGFTPRFPQRQISISQGDKVVLNNIYVSNSNIGVLNTGNLQIVDSAITVLNGDQNTREISLAISKLANAIAGSTELPIAKRNEAMEFLGAVAAEATIPKEKRRNSIVRTLLDALPTTIQTSASLLQIWQSVEPIIKPYFQ